MRTTEQLAPEAIAPEAIAQMIPMLVKLTTNQPTTVELEEALLTNKAMTRALFEWLAARYIAQAAARQAYGIPVESSGEAEEPDHIERSHVHAHFAPLLAPMKGTA